MERGRCYCFPSVWSNSKVPKCLKNALLHTPVVKHGGKKYGPPEMVDSGFGFMCIAEENELPMFSN